ncbi:MAG: hypothetical protein U0166_16025 [Acidobacteriota bacterium]
MKRLAVASVVLSFLVVAPCLAGQPAAKTTIDGSIASMPQKGVLTVNDAAGASHTVILSSVTTVKGKDGKVVATASLQNGMSVSITGQPKGDKFNAIEITIK